LERFKKGGTSTESKQDETDIREKQVSQTSESADLAIQHDRENFKKLDDITNEQQFYAYFYSLQAGHRFSSEIDHKLAKYDYFTQFEGYKYVNRDLQNLHEKFIECWATLDKHISPHTFPLDSDTSTLKVHFPVPGDEHWRWATEEKLNQLNEEFDSEFTKLTDNAEKAYSTYRAAIRDILYI
ncbi:hypothetical protein ACFLYF_06535, partial [Chloroflexota bacterium]